MDLDWTCREKEWTTGNVSEITVEGKKGDKRNMKLLDDVQSGVSFGKSKAQVWNRSEWRRRGGCVWTCQTAE